MENKLLRKGRGLSKDEQIVRINMIKDDLLYLALSYFLGIESRLVITSLLIASLDKNYCNLIYCFLPSSA